MHLILWLTARALVAGAGTPFTQSYRVVGLESSFICAQKKARDPAAVCTPKVTASPESMTMKITSNGPSRTFELSSDCQVLKATLKPKGDGYEVTPTKDSSHCEGRDLSLQHEALFSSALKITKIEEMSGGQVRARINDMLGIILAPTP